jgi:hypothetical protein|tara:strand:- start:323 stop:466 length:144 start_codon:yes stop_codon:yes gene_type:complete
MKVGDLVRYMSRIVLIIDISDDVWIEGVELGETEIARYKRHVLKELS